MRAFGYVEKMFELQCTRRACCGADTSVSKQRRSHPKMKLGFVDSRNQSVFPHLLLLRSPRRYGPAAASSSSPVSTSRTKSMRTLPIFIRLVGTQFQKVAVLGSERKT